MPVTTIMSGGMTYCQWHRSCLTAPAHARSQEACAMWLEWLQREYPSDGWWSLPIEQLWPVLQGVQTIWQIKQEAA